MSAKRPAQQTINEKTLQYNDQNPKSEIQNGTQRVILQVKRDGDDPLPKTTPQTRPNSTNQEEKPKLLFSNLFQNTQGVGLFSNVGIFSAARQGLLGSNQQTPKIDFKAPNLFTNNGFASKSNSSTGNSLLSDKSSPTFAKVFDFGEGNIPPVKSGDKDQDDDGDSAQLQNGQTMVIDKTKSKGHYDYKQEVKVLFSGNARKYKKNNGDLIEGVQVVLQHDEKNKLVYLIMRLAATKHTIFTGYILQGKSQVRVLNNKEENLQIAVFAIKKNKPAQKDKLKLQLDTPQNGKALLTKLQDAIAGKLNSQTKEEEQEKKQEKQESKEQGPKKNVAKDKQEAKQSNL